MLWTGVGFGQVGFAEGSLEVFSFFNHIDLFKRRTGLRWKWSLARSGMRNRYPGRLESPDKCRQAAGCGQLTTADKPVGGARATPVPVLKATPLTTVALFC